MINIIFSIVLASISVAQVNIFEVDGIFSSAHVRSVERHFEEFEYEKNDLFIVQYSSKQFSSERLQQFNNLILSQDFYTALWVGPYKVDLDFNTINSFDFVGYTPGVNLINVEFTDSIEAQYCTINICNYENRTIKLSEKLVKFKSHLIEDQEQRLKNQSIDCQIIDISELTNIENYYGLYPTVGENLDFLNSNNLKIDFLYRNLDQLAWQYCNKGFFNFKNYIPKIVSSFN